MFDVQIVRQDSDAPVAPLRKWPRRHRSINLLEENFIDMQEEKLSTKLTKKFEQGVLVAAQVLLMAVILAMVIQLWAMFATAVSNQLSDIDSVPELMKSVQTAFSGLLLVILGLELMETLRVYFKSHRIRLETILAVAIIAIGRHVINLDVEHMPGTSLLGIAAIVLVLTAGYFLVRYKTLGPVRSDAS